MIFEDRELLEWSRKGVKILKENANLQTDNRRDLPNNAHVVTIDWDGNMWCDIVQGSRVQIFDMYYDKFGQGCIKSIVQSEGRISPRLWGNTQPKKEK
jgi:FAD/FMN-containing dehydrogenase